MFMVKEFGCMLTLQTFIDLLSKAVPLVASK
jgi:hypothetical protein